MRTLSECQDKNALFVYNNTHMAIVRDPNLIDEALTRGVDAIYPSKEALKKRLLGGERLRLYLGVDPTGAHLHLGHATNLLTLKRFQNLGHEIIFLIGDFTARIGDPTDKSAARQPLTEKEVRANFKNFKKQAGRIVSFGWRSGAKVAFNSSWLGEMKFADVLELQSHFTVQQMLERDMFKERLRAGKPIGVHEFMYPLMQGYDSVALDVGLEIGGTDQTFNMLVGRTLLKIYKGKEKFVLSTKLLEHPKTGKKLMNKSEGGLINLDDEPGDLFGKVMALDDVSMFPLAEFSTEMSLARVNELQRAVEGGKMNPRDAKLEIAGATVGMVWGERAAAQAAERFQKIFSKRDARALPRRDSVTATTAIGVVYEIGTDEGFIKSRSEARRLVEQGALEIDGIKFLDPNEIVPLAKEESHTTSAVYIGPKHAYRVCRKSGHPRGEAAGDSGEKK